MNDAYSPTAPSDGDPLPRWWTWLFSTSIGFAIGSFALSLLLGDQVSTRAAYDAAVDADLRRQFGEIGVLKGDDATVLAYSRDPKWLAVGQSIYMNNCVSCHGRDGAGWTSAPNLTDETAIYIRHPSDIVEVVTNGRKAGAMPSWRGRLNSNEIVLVASYVASLRGKNIKGRPPEGATMPAWETSQK